MSRYLKGIIILDDVKDSLSEIELDSVLNKANSNRIDFNKILEDIGSPDSNTETENKNYYN